MSRISVRTRVTGTLAAAAAIAALGVGSAAQATTTPSIANDANSAVIATEGPGHSLQFYWQAAGTTPWHRETVAGLGTTYSAPTVTQDGNSAVIAAEGPNHSLRFYWAVNGTSTWHRELVAVHKLDQSAPAISVNTGVSPSRINIVTEGPEHSAFDFWQSTGALGWNVELVGLVNSTHSAPGVSSNTVGTLVTAAGPGGGLLFYWEGNGTTTWHPEVVAFPGSVA
jgi:hypothetical protein